VLDGAHLVTAYIDAGFTPLSIAIRAAAIASADAEMLLSRIDANRVTVYSMADDIIDKASSLESAASIMAVITTPQSQPTPHNINAVIVLDNVQDPGNVGSILRSAAAFGISHALLGIGSAQAWSPKVIRAGQGAHFVLNIEEGADVAAWLKSYQGQRVALVSNEEKAAALFTINLTTPSAFIIGSEGAGISADVLASATKYATIPMSGKMESLNASACAAIVMYEWHRQQLLVKES